MRLTTLNIRKKYLLAGCCMANYMTDHWNYIEEGNIEKANCSLTKALKLDALRGTLLRYNPVIKDAKFIKSTTTITAGSFTYPYSYNALYVNGIEVANPQYIHTASSNFEVLKKTSCSINGLISGNDDVVDVSIEVSESPSVQSVLTVIYNEDQSPVTITVDQDGGSGVTSTVTTTDEADYTYPAQCLTEAQILSVIRKIDELCECEC